MQNTGPYFLSKTGQIEYADDPAVHLPSSERVQIQNYSGFLITVMAGGVNYLLPSLSSSTIPTRGAPSIIMTASQVQNTFGQSVNMVWLQRGEIAAMADGPLTLGNTQSLGLLSVSSYNDAPPPGGTTILAKAPTGYVYSIYSVSVDSSLSTGTQTADFYSDSAKDYPGFVVSYGATPPATPVSENGLLMPGLFVVSTAIPMEGTIRYDVFPAPVS